MRTRRSLTALLLFLLFVLLLPTPRWWWWCISISLPHCVCSCFLPSFLSFSLALAISCLLFFSCFLPLACVVHRYLLLWGGNCLSSGDEGNAQASRESARGGQVENGRKGRMHSNETPFYSMLYSNTACAILRIIICVQCVLFCSNLMVWS